MLGRVPQLRRFGAPVLYAVGTVALLLRTAPGRVGIDTKQYLFLDPGRVLEDATTMWHPGVAFGTVPHQNIGFAWPMGPFFWLGETLGLPDWVTQRFWLAGLLVVAGLGIRWFARTLGLPGAAAWVAGLVYAWGPFSLGYMHRTSVLLLPWAGLGFLLVFVSRAIRRGGWRDPAAFALVAATVGGANATALLLAGLAPTLLVLHLALDPDVGWRRAAAGAGRAALLSAGVSLWWFVALVVQGRFSLNILRYTETIDAVARSTSSTEVLRGLGYWLFYGRDRLGPWIEPAPPYQTSTALLLLSFALPLLGVAALLFVRSGHRGFSASLLVVGVVVSVGAFPWDDPSPLGSLVKHLATSSDAGLALRSATRAVPLISLAIALGLATAVAALSRIRPSSGAVASALVVALAFAALPPLWQGRLVSEDLSRPEEIPSAWTDAAAHVERTDDGTRVLEIPGIDLTFHRWGATWEPVTPGLIDRPFAARELVPYGGPGSVDLLRALDRRMQDGTIEPGAIAPVARLLGAGDLLVRSDLEYERFRTPRPALLWDVIRRASGLGQVTSFGDIEPNRAGPELPLRDEIALGAPDALEVPPPVAAIDVPDVPPLVRAAPLDGAVVMAGSGEGVVDAAAAGLLDRPTLLLYSASFAADDSVFDTALERGADLLVTDSNRKQAERWRTLRDNVGYTETADETPLVDDESDARLELFPDAGPEHRSVTVTTGARAQATAYGNPVTYTPSDRPQLALDGDTATAWTVGAFDDPRGERLVVTFDEPRHVPELEVVLAPDAGRRITELTVHADGTRVGTVTFSDASPRAVDLSELDELSVVEFEIADTAPRSTGGAGAPPVGIAEVRIPGLDATEFVRAPVDLVRTVEDDLDHRLGFVLTRLRSDPSEAVRADDELALRRIVEVPSPRRFSLDGSVRLAHASDDVVWSLIGSTGPTVRASDSLPGDLRSRPWSALDGDPETAWQTAFGPQEGRWLEIELPAAVTFRELTIDSVDDDDHSVPTALTIQAGGVTRQVSVPTDGDGTLSFAPLTGDSIRIRIDEVRPTTTRDWYRLDDITMPVAIAELTIEGVAQTRQRSEVDDRCRDDLLEIDGRPVGLRVRGEMSEALLGRPLSVRTCDGTGLSLEAETRIEAMSGDVTGLDVDRLVLVSARGGTPDTSGAPFGETATLTPTVRVRQDADTEKRLTVDTEGAPALLVLGQNRNDGWEATANGVDLGSPVLVDGYANGWVLPETDGPIDVALSWEPQRAVSWAVWASIAVALVCVALVIVAPRDRSVVSPRGDAPAFGLGSKRSIPWGATTVLAVGAGLAVAGVAGPLGALPVALLTVLGCRLRSGHALVGGASLLLLGAAFGLVVVEQRRRRWNADFDWPSHFVTSHRLALLGVLIAGTAVLSSAARRHFGDRHRSAPEDVRW